MALLFLTGSLEPIKDGVGDYTRQLAGECIRRGHPCRIVALNDPYVSAPTESVETTGGVPLRTLRLPATLPWAERIERAPAFRKLEPCEWVSLQFVCYAFDRKGLVRDLADHLEPMIDGCQLHFMFHEIWIGVGESRPLRKRLMGQMQRHYIRKLVRRLEPDVITTSNPFYQMLLEQGGISASELPLFGNIAIEAASAKLRLPDTLVCSGFTSETGAHPERWLGLFFGALHPEWTPEPLMTILIAAGKKAGKRVSLISVGRLGQRGEIALGKVRQAYAGAVDFIVLGEQPVPQISALLQTVDFGLAASPWHVLGKSGSVTAMLEHGLPVIVASDHYRPAVSASRPDDPLLHRCDAALEAKLMAGLPRREAKSRLQDVAGEFLRKLALS